MRSSSLQSLTLDDIPVAIVATRDDGTITAHNQLWTATFGSPDVSSLYHAAPAASKIFLQTHIIPTILKEGSAQEIYIKLTRADGTVEPVLLNATRRVQDGQAQTIWSIFIARQRRKLEEELLHRKTRAEEMAKTIEKSAKELARSNEALSTFAGVVAHDLKAPLGHIRMISELLALKMPPEAVEKINDYVTLLQDSSESTIRLVDDLLRYSLIDENHGDFKELQMADFLHSIFKMLAPPEHFKLDYEGDLPTLTTLHVPFELILRNLINNAIKHHDGQNGEIRVTLSEHPHHYDVTVSDNGPGIAPEFHDAVFGQTNRLSNRRKTSGFGLGLYLVKNTVDAYGGSVRIVSRKGEGTSFVFQWPKQDILAAKIGAA